MKDSESLGSFKPYLLRAHHEWMVDNGLTPHLIVDASMAGVNVPLNYVEDGSIVLNVAPRAVSGLVLGDDELSFSARFNGVGTPVVVPMRAVRGLVAREYGVGVSFPDESDADDVTVEGAVHADGDAAASEADKRSIPAADGRPALRLVK